MACDRLRAVYDRSHGLDGRVSIEVSPRLANDSAGTLAAAKRLHAAVARPNVMIKIPATAAGLPAITAAIAAGISINVTLIFSLARYREVMDAYLSGLEQLAAAGRRPGARCARSRRSSSRASTARWTPPSSSARRRCRPARRSARSSSRCAARPPWPTRASPTPSSSRVFGGAALCRAARQRRPRAAPAVGLDEHQEPGLSRRALRRGADRPRHGQHHAARRRSWRSTTTAWSRRASATTSPAARALFARLPQLGVPIDTLIDQLEGEGVVSFAKSYDDLLGALDARVKEMAAR